MTHNYKGYTIERSGVVFYLFDQNRQVIGILTRMKDCKKIIDKKVAA